MGCGPSACENSVIVSNGRQTQSNRSSSNSRSRRQGSTQSNPQQPRNHTANFSILLDNARINSRAAQPSTIQHVSLNNRLQHNRQMLMLRESLEFELNQPAEEGDETAVQERQMRVDALLARMMFEEELSSLELGRFRGGLWSGAPQRVMSPEARPAAKGLTAREIDRATRREVYAKVGDMVPDDEKTYCYECILCLAEYADGDDLRYLSCGHIFHMTCVDEWLVRNKTCPLCSQVVGTSSPTTSDATMAATDASAVLMSQVLGAMSIEEAPLHDAAVDDAAGAHHLEGADQDGPTLNEGDEEDEAGTDEEDEEEEDVETEEGSVREGFGAMHNGDTVVLPLGVVGQVETPVFQSQQLLPHRRPSHSTPSGSPMLGQQWSSVIFDQPGASGLLEPSLLEDCEVRYDPLSDASVKTEERFRADQPQRSSSPQLPASSSQPKASDDWSPSTYPDDASSVASEDLPLPDQSPEPRAATVPRRSLSLECAGALDGAPDFVRMERPAST